MRVIGPEGTQIGVMSSNDARKLAEKVGLDLVEIAANARPPVCRILDYGKYMYEQSKKEKESKSHSTTSKLKEIKLRVRVDAHDYLVKLRHAEEFLNEGNKVKVSLMFRGRENEHRGIGVDVVKRCCADLDHIAQVDAPPKLVGRNVTAILSPLPQQKRKLKYIRDKVLNEENELPPSMASKAKTPAKQEDAE